MLKYYQELLNECIDLSEHKKKHKEMKSTLNKIKNLTSKMKGENMGYQKIKDIISDIDEFHNEAELREILQEILFICNDNINKKEPSISNQTEKSWKGKHFSITDPKGVKTVIYEIYKTEKKYLNKYFLFLFYHKMVERARRK